MQVCNSIQYATVCHTPLQSGWIQKALFLRSGGAKAKVICDEWDNEHYSGYSG